MLVGVVAVCSFISVVSASRARRAAEQSGSGASTVQPNGNNSAISDAKQSAQRSPATLNDLSQRSASHHWAALQRFSTTSVPAGPLAAVITATKADAIAIDVDNDTKADPGDTLEYTVVVSNTGNADATNTVFTDTLTDTNLMFVPGSVTTTPLARPDSYTGIVGNVLFTQNAAGGVLANDSDPDNVGPALTVTAGNITSTNSGNVVMSADGSFTYNPPVGYEGTDTFTYTLNDNEGNTDTGTVSITVAGMVWFINNNAGACASNCDGRLTNPFTTLASFQTVNDGIGVSHPAAGDNIFIYESATAYSAAVTLLSNQKLIGQDATATLSTITGLNPPNSNFPATNSGNGTIVKITNAGNAIVVNSAATTNLIRGLTVGNTGTGIGISGTGFGTLTVLDVDISDGVGRTGQALSLATGTLSATFASIKSTNSSAAGIALTTVGGSLTSGSTSITNPATFGINIATSSATFSFGNTSVTQSGDTGVSLSTNTGTITFGTLDITPDASKRGLHAVNNTTTITANSGGAISTSGAVAVEITRSSSTTPIVISLTNVSANGGTNGIVLSNTSGSFTVAGSTSGQCGGSATANSGTTPGTATAPVTGDCTGGTIQSTSGFGISLNNVTNVSLTRMWIKSAGDDGIHGTTVNGFSLISSFVENNGNGANEHGIDIVQLLGTCAITNSKVSGSSDNNVFVNNNAAGTLSALNITGSQFSATSPTIGADGILIKPESTSNVTVSVSSSFFSNNRDNHIQMAPTDSAVSKITINNNTFTDNTATTLGGDIVINPVNNTNTKAIVTNNDISGAVLSPLNFNLGVGSTVASVFHVTATGNFIGNTGVNSSGSETANGIQVWGNGEGTINALVSNNDVRQFNHFYGINVAHQDGNGFINLTMKGNLVTEKDNSGLLLDGVRIEAGAVNTDAGTICADIGDPTVAANKNTIATTPNGGADLRIRLRINAKMTFPGYGGGASDTTALAAYLTSRNILATATATTSSAAAIPFGNAGAGCTQPLTSAPVFSDPNMTKGLGAETDSSASLSARKTGETEDILRATHGEGPGGYNLHKLTPAEVAAMVQAAIERWREAGISAQDLARLQAMTFEITDLPESQLASATSTSVRLDETAAGYGWYSDSAPMEDSEFDVAVPNRELQTTDLSPAAGRMDLLTVIMRELGIAYKQGRKTVIKGLKPLMENTLSPAVRRLPKSQNITLPTPRVGVTDADQSGNTTNLGAQASTADASNQNNTRSLNHAASRTAGSLAPAAPDVTVNIGNLPQAKSITIKFRAQIKDPLVTPASSVSNQGHVHADGPIDVDTTDPGPPSVNGATVTPLDVADLQLTKTDSPDPVSAGANITYTLNFKNNGPSAANMVALSDAVPANTTFVSVTTPAGWTRTDSVAAGGTGTLTWTKDADAANQETAVFTIVVKVNSNVADASMINNSATVTSPKTDPDSNNNTATASTTVQTRADLQMSKSDTPDPVIAGQNITYTVNYQNNGPSDAQSVQLADVIPTNTTFVSVTTPSGWTRTDSVAAGGTGTITFTKATSLVSDTASFTLVVKVSPSAAHGSTITNNATASSATTDPTPGNDTGTTTTTVNRQADLELTKSDSPDVNVNAGDNITYTLTLTNHGPSNSSTVVVSDAVPANTTLVSASTSSAGWSRTDVVASGGTGTITFAKSDVGDSEVATFTIVVNVNGNAPHNSTITNTATRTTATTDPVNTNDSGTTMTNVINQADLAVTKTDSPDPVLAGNNLTYTITVMNNGPGSANSASMSDAMPAGTTFVSVNTPSGWTRTDAVAVGGNGTITFTNPSVANGASAIFTLVLKVSASTANNTTLTNHALVTCTNESDNSNNDSGAVDTTVNTSADIQVTKTDSPDPVTAGNNLTYTVTITNNGPSDAQSVSLTDTTPTHTTFVSGQQNNGPVFNCAYPMAGTTGTASTCTIATLAAGASAEFQIVVHVDSDTANGTHIMNTASGATTTSDPTSGNNDGTSDTTVNTSADLEVSKSDTPDPVNAGQDITYTINFKNNGPSDAQSVSVSDATPANTTFVSVTTPAGWTRTDSVAVGGTGTISFTKSTVANQETASFTLVLKVNSNTAAGTVITNTATKSSTTSDSNNANDSGQTTTTVATSADIEVTKSDTPDPVTANSNITYTISVKNNGPSDAQTLGLSDTLPANTTFVSLTVPAGWTRTDAVAVGGTGTITATATTQAANTSADFTLVVKVDANTPHATVITNNATATSATTDPTPGNETGTTTTTVNAQADLSVTKTDLADPVMLGSDVNYHIVVKNNGAGDALGVVLTDKMPQSVTFVSATPSTGSCMQAATTVTCNLGDMLNGAEVTVDIVIRATTVNTVSDTVSVTSSVADPVSNNNHDTETTRVVGFRAFSFSPPIFTGGCPGNSVGTLLFTSAAPAGIQINFTDASAAVDPIASVTTVGGELSIQAPATTHIVTAQQIVNVTASHGTNSLVGRLKILPIRITSLTFDQNPVVGGNVVTATVTLTCPAPQDILVRLSFDKAVAKPDVTTFTIPMGQTSGQFTITTKHPLSQTVATITASANGGYLRSTITVTP
jgi:uncharacterized repeat protein (TIGR01451 family)